MFVFAIFSLAAVTCLAADLQLPVVLPPFGTDQASVKSPKASWGTCLLYAEGLNVHVYSTAQRQGHVAVVSSDPDLGNTYTFKDDYVKCPNVTDSKEWKSSEYEFTIDTQLKKPAKGLDKDGKTMFTVDGSVALTLKFATEKGFVWSLKSVTLAKPLNVKAESSGGFLSKDISLAEGTEATPGSVKASDVGAYNNYNFACSKTKAVVFQLKDLKDYQVGVSFGNIQIQKDGYQLSKDQKSVHFTHLTHDCVGTFSAGSWMGIIVGLLLASVLMFGFIMLNSVQTTDRFDDPKQKQLIINSKD